MCRVSVCRVSVCPRPRLLCPAAGHQWPPPPRTDMSLETSEGRPKEKGKVGIIKKVRGREAGVALAPGTRVARVARVARACWQVTLSTGFHQLANMTY